MSDIKLDHMVLTAVSSECQPFLESVACETIEFKGLPLHIGKIGTKRVAFCVCGIGTSFTAMVAASLYMQFDPEVVWFSGTCGAIESDLAIGDVVIASSAFEAEIQGLNNAFVGTPFAEGLLHPAKKTIPPLKYSADKALLQTARDFYNNLSQVNFGELASTNTFPTPKHLYSELKLQNVLAIDMETSALYQFGWLFGAKTLAVRCVSNLLDSEGDDPDISSAKPELAAATAAQCVLDLLGDL